MKPVAVHRLAYKLPICCTSKLISPPGGVSTLKVDAALGFQCIDSHVVNLHLLREYGRLVWWADEMPSDSEIE